MHSNVLRNMLMNDDVEVKGSNGGPKKVQISIPLSGTVEGRKRRVPFIPTKRFRCCVEAIGDINWELWLAMPMAKGRGQHMLSISSHLVRVSRSRLISFSQPNR